MSPADLIILRALRDCLVDELITLRDSRVRAILNHNAVELIEELEYELR